MKANLPLNLGDRLICIDVFSWLREISRCQLSGVSIPVNGIFRHLDAWSRLVNPAMLVTLSEVEQLFGSKKNFGRAVNALASHLNREIRWFDPFTVCDNGSIAVWVTPAPDHLCPHIGSLHRSVLKVALLSDVMALKGFYGSGNFARAKDSLQFQDIYLSVSNTTTKDFLPYFSGSPKELSAFILPYGCPHGVEVVCSGTPLYDRHGALTVHVGFSYKNLEESSVLARRLNSSRRLCHVGYMPEEGGYSQLELDSFGQFVAFHGVLSEPNLLALYRSSLYYVFMSKEEGFSITPMEAILNGVPYVFLSDIPVHREIYGDLNVNFVPLGQAGSFPLIALKMVQDEDRHYLLERFRFSRLVQPFFSYLESVL